MHARTRARTHARAHTRAYTMSSHRGRTTRLPLLHTGAEPLNNQLFSHGPNHAFTTTAEMYQTLQAFFALIAISCALESSMRTTKGKRNIFRKIIARQSIGMPENNTELDFENRRNCKSWNRRGWEFPTTGPALMHDQMNPNWTQ